MAAPTLIIFDVDGTLVNSYPAIIASVHYTLQKTGLPLLRADRIRRAVGWGDRQLIAAFVGRKGIDKALALYRQHHKRSLREKIAFMPYARRLLTYLKKRGYIIAIASNRPRRFLSILLRRLRIEQLFDYVLCKDQIGFGKPHPSILNKIVKHLRVPKKNVLYVGDMVIDVETGKRAGVRTCAVATGSNTFRELRRARPDFLYRDLSSLFTLLESTPLKK